MASALGSPHPRASYGSNSSSDRSLDEEVGALPARGPRAASARNGRAMRLGARRSTQEAVEQQALLQPKKDAESGWGDESDEVCAPVIEAEGADGSR